MVIDAHHHVWSLRDPHVTWPSADLPALHRDFDHGDLAAEVGENVQLAGAVLVQSQAADADTEALLALATRTSVVAAVVGWADLTSPDAPRRIEALAARSKLTGLRPMLQALPDAEWILQPALAPAFKAMTACGLRLDALAQPRHLRTLVRFVDRWPGLPLVVDHAAKPAAGGTPSQAWLAGMSALARAGAYCKLSGLRTEQPPGAPWRALAPFVEALVEAFGPRLMWGSDWPVLRLAGDRWGDWLRAAEALAAPANAAARARLFAGCAAEFYGLSEISKPRTEHAQ